MERMMYDNGYIPTTYEVAARYAAYRGSEWEIEGYDEQFAHAEFARWLAKRDAEVAATIADRVRRNCTPSVEAYAAGGDAVILAVADWIESPPEWVDAPWAGRGK